MRLLFAALTLTVSFPTFVQGQAWYNRWYDLGVYGAYPTQTYATIDLVSPHLNIPQWNPKCNDDQYTLLTPRGRAVPEPGPVVMDARGNLVWMEKKFGEVMDMKVQRYGGEDYLTFWVGTDDGTHGRGTYYMLNSSYDVVHKINPVGKLEGDLHEFKITENGTALMTVYEIIPGDLSGMGREDAGWIYDGLFQEIDIATGALLFQWRASEFYKAHETYEPLGNKAWSKKTAFDYFHINSIDKDPLGNYYVSSRYMHTVTCISPTGEVLWVLGGRRNSFTDLSGGAATNFSWQHHANWHSNNTITIFDNGSTDEKATADYSRGLMISLDLDSMTATLVQEFVHPQKILTSSQGSVQILPETGNVFVGWGHSPGYTEYSPEGEVLCDVHFGASIFFNLGWVKSYRTFKSDWVGKPNTRPEIAISSDRNSIFTSWNGATEVVGWGLQVSDFEQVNDRDWYTRDYVQKTGFEAKFDLPIDTRDWFRTVAMDKNGNALAYSKAINRRDAPVYKQAYRLTDHPYHLLTLAIISLITTIAAIIISCVFLRILWQRIRLHRSSRSCISRTETASGVLVPLISRERTKHDDAGILSYLNLWRGGWKYRLIQQRQFESSNDTDDGFDQLEKGNSIEIDDRTSTSTPQPGSPS